MMTVTNLSSRQRFVLFKQGVNWMVKVNWLPVVENDRVTMTRSEHYGHEFLTRTLRVMTFEEVITVKIGKNSKLGNY